jgi:hypothetical protein
MMQSSQCTHENIRWQTLSSRLVHTTRPPSAQPSRAVAMAVLLTMIRCRPSFQVLVVAAPANHHRLRLRLQRGRHACALLQT